MYGLNSDRIQILDRENNANICNKKKQKINGKERSKIFCSKITILYVQYSEYKKTIETNK